jgi:Zn-dependent alcohol dehydrogenase
MTRAAIHTGSGNPLEIREIELQAPGPGELLIRMAASGVCHSDLSVQNGTTPRPGPLILGHEGAGVVEQVGPDTVGFSVGDHVAISWVPQCHECAMCRRGQAHLCETGAAPMSAGSMLDGTFRATLDGSPLPQYCAVGTFAERAVIPVSSAVKVPTNLDLRVVALLGCCVLTGVGAAINTASIAKGDSVAVIGCGGVGLNVLQGALLAGAERVVAIDRSQGKLDLARALGATDVVLADDDPVKAVLDLTDGRGVDVAFEAVGLAATGMQALSMTRHGGEAVLIGVAAPTETLAIPVMRGLVRYARTLKGCFYGSADVIRDVPLLIEAYEAGRLDLDSLVSKEISLDEVNEAFAVMDRGDIARSVIVF